MNPIPAVVNKAKHGWAEAFQKGAILQSRRARRTLTRDIISTTVSRTESI
jgi:hypothetical protein